MQVWSPYLKKDIECLEKFNCSPSLHLLQTFKGIKNEPYSERLALLHTSSLAKRRVRGDLLQAYRIMKGIDKVEMKHFFELDDCAGYDLRGHSLKVLRFREVALNCDKDTSAKELSVHGTVYRLLLLRLSLSSCSRKGWMIGVKMWIFKASASRPLHLQVTNYKLL